MSEDRESYGQEPEPQGTQPQDVDVESRLMEIRKANAQRDRRAMRLQRRISEARQELEALEAERSTDDRERRRLLGMGD